MQTLLFLLHLTEYDPMLLPILDNFSLLVEEVHFAEVDCFGGFDIEEVTIIVFH
jgi:hypothetical protein